jgi:vancomycin resistance protein YoaR
MKFPIAIFATCAAFAAAPRAFAVMPTAAPTSQNAPKTNVAGVDVTGLSPVLVRQRLTRELAPRLLVKHALHEGDVQVWRARRDFGAQLDITRVLARLARGERYVPLLLKVEREAAIRALRRLASRYEVKLRDAKPIELRGKVVITPERAARTLNVGASAVALTQQIESDASQRVLKLRANVQKPHRTREDLRGIDGVIARFSTRYDTSKIGRTENMRVAIRAIDGTIVKSGSVFSLNDTVGERTAARGYKNAIIFEEGKRVEGLGGGVSQVTGTLFNAALEAGLPIVSYRTHSRPVAYLPLGRDATVAWGQFDMKFKNNTSAPVYIAYSLDERRARIVLFGKKVAARRVEMKVTSRTLGEREIRAQLFRTVRDGKKVVAKERVGTSHYKWKIDEQDAP